MAILAPLTRFGVFPMAKDISKNKKNQGYSFLVSPVIAGGGNVRTFSATAYSDGLITDPSGMTM
jgi:hypothetical protein